jgi:hypothetical protein
VIVRNFFKLSYCVKLPSERKKNRHQWNVGNHSSNWILVMAGDGTYLNKIQEKVVHWVTFHKTEL